MEKIQVFKHPIANNNVSIMYIPNILYYTTVYSYSRSVPGKYRLGMRRYLRPVSGCIRPWCVLGVTFALAGCFGLLTFVLLLANSSRMVCGMSGSNRTPCCRNQTHNNTVLPSRVGNQSGQFPPKYDCVILGKVWHGCRGRVVFARCQ